MNLRLQQSVLGKLKASWLFHRNAALTSAPEVIGWWEARRIPYNLIVGCAGLLTCIGMGVLATAASILFSSDIGLPNPPIFVFVGIFLFAIGANVCYTGGWVTELALRKIAPRESDKIATLSFSLGVAFSVLLALFPAFLTAAVGFFGFVKLVVHHWRC